MILTAQHRTPTAAIFADDAGRRLEIPLDDPFANEQRIHVSVSPARGFGGDRENTTYTPSGGDAA